MKEVTLTKLLDGPIEIGPGSNKHLSAATLGKKLRLRLDTLEQPSDAEEWEAFRSKLGGGKVMCPECEGDTDAPCSTCEGEGMVAREVWEQWFFETKGCRNYKPSCHLTCLEERCAYDIGHADQETIVLCLEVLKGTDWKSCGNSIHGYRLQGLAKNKEALARYLNFVCEVNNIPCFAFDEEEGE